MYHTFWGCSSVSGHLACFHVLAVGVSILNQCFSRKQWSHTSHLQCVSVDSFQKRDLQGLPWLPREEHLPILSHFRVGAPPVVSLGDACVVLFPGHPYFPWNLLMVGCSPLSLCVSYAVCWGISPPPIRMLAAHRCFLSGSWDLLPEQILTSVKSPFISPTRVSAPGSRDHCSPSLNLLCSTLCSVPSMCWVSGTWKNK